MSARASAAILAGGRARRFGGRDKSRLIVEGYPIINRQVEVLQRLADPVFIIAGDSGRFADLGLPIYADAIEGAGTLGGIYSALEVSPLDAVLVVACDLPFLHAGLLGRLVELAQEGDAAWVRSDRGPEPTLACYRRIARHTIRRQIEAGRLKASDLSAVLAVAEMDLTEVARFGPPTRLLANINTPEDYARVVNP